MNSLFAKPEGVSVGDHFLDIELDRKGEPHPMKTVRVTGIDNTGMIHLVCAIAGLGGMSRIVSADRLRSEYRKVEEE